MHQDEQHQAPPGRHIGNRYEDGFLEQNLSNCLTKTQCDGGGECWPHGKLSVVRIIDDSGITAHDWGYYCYCQNAINEDRRRGMTVIEEGDADFMPNDEVTNKESENEL